LMKLLGR